MRLKDIPVAPAYFVEHDLYDNGAMNVWPCESFERALEHANVRSSHADSVGFDGVCYMAYAKLPRKRISKYHSNMI